MRRLSARGALRHGLTLVELMAGLAISVILLGMASPLLTDFSQNSRLHEGGNALLAEALYAQGEAIKRNSSLRLVVADNSLQVRDLASGGDGTLLRSRQLPDGVVGGSASIDFGSRGMPLPFGTDAAIDLGKTGVTCSAELRCPGLRIDGGGAIRLCSNRLSCE